MDNNTLLSEIALSKKTNSTETDIIANEECLKILENIVSLLPKRERELFLMKSRGMKEREIATQMDSPPGTIASWISRMIKQIQEELQKHNCLH